MYTRHFDVLMPLFARRYPRDITEPLYLLLANVNAGSLKGYSITANRKDEFLSTVFCNAVFITCKSLSDSLSQAHNHYTIVGSTSKERMLLRRLCISQFSLPLYTWRGDPSSRHCLIAFFPLPHLFFFISLHQGQGMTPLF